MEKEERSQRWKMHLPEFKHSRRSPNLTTEDNESGDKGNEKGRSSQHKSVTMAPTSRYLTDRQYVMRKPLFAAEQHTSILKKTHAQTHREKASLTKEEVKQQHTDMIFSTGTEEKKTHESFRLSYGDTLTPSVSREDIRSPPMGVSELRSRLFHEDSAFGSSIPGSRSPRQNLSSSFLEVQRLNPPLRPRLTSTVLHPTYTPLSGKSKRDPTQLRQEGREDRNARENKLPSTRENSVRKPMSPYQENYWSCAIPKSLPPSPDRHSASWDPNREYQALLDYTYPLRPGHMSSEWDTSELQGDSFLQTDPNLQDSGIELDRLCSSSPLPGLRIRETTGRGSVRQRSPDLQRSTESSDGLPSSTLLSLRDPGDLSFESQDFSKNTGRVNYKRDVHRHQHHALSSSSSSTSAAFRRSTSVLPRSRCACLEIDEEFWPLPDQLEELQLLSRQVREVTAQLSRPVTASWESLEPGTNSVMSSITLPERQEVEDREQKGDNGDTDAGKDETDIEGRTPALTDLSDSEARRTTETSVEPDGGGLSRSSLREVETLVEQLSGLTLPGSQRNLEEHRQRDSLLQHIKVFCSHLEQLIQRLYSVSEKMELLSAPTVDIDSVKSSLAEYQSFQREVSSHQPLVSCVLHTGQLLLSCINTTSPFLRDALLLIERQSGALESHTEHFFSSILSAMDSLTQPSVVQQSREEEPSPAGV